MPPVFPNTTLRIARGTLIVGGACLLLGLLLSHFGPPAGDRATVPGAALLALAPDRAWPNLLLAAYYLVGLGLAGGLFLALQYVSRGGWSVAFRRVPEAMTAVLPFAAAGMLVTALGAAHLYAWSRPETVAADALLRAKSVWLNPAFFVLRTIAYGIVWTLLLRAVVGCSRAQDQDGDIQWTERSVRRSALFLVLFGVTFSAATFDWILSLDPHWFSTIFAVYAFAGVFVSGLSAMTVLVILFRRNGTLSGVVNDDHLHDCGKLIFGFATFWAYLWFSQYMLVWYGNLPEETSYYLLRHSGGWGPLAITNLLLNWGIPFLVLLPRPAKRNENTLLVVAGILLTGHWLDLYLMILPPFSGSSPAFGPWELCSAIMVPAAFILIVAAAFRRAPAVPTRDPFLAESLHHHV